MSKPTSTLGLPLSGFVTKASRAFGFPSFTRQLTVTAFITLLIGASLAMSALPSQAASTSVRSGPNYGGLFTSDGRYFCINNAYDLPQESYMDCYLNSKDDHGGYWDFNGKTGGIGVGQLCTGDFLDWNPTANSQFPLQINDGSNTYANWGFSGPWIYSDPVSTAWQAYWELWVHSGNPAEIWNVSTDIMIHPKYNVNKYDKGGTYIETVYLSDSSWDVHLGYSPGGFEIVHFYRNSQTDNLTVHLDDFWDYAASKGWCSNTDWVGSVTTGVEAFNGRGAFASYSWICNTDGGNPSDLTAS